MHAFWDISGPLLKAICRYMEVDVKDSQNDLDRLWVLMLAVFPKKKHEELVQILEGWVRKLAQLDDMLLLEEAEDLINDDDKQAFQRYVDNAKAGQKSAATFVESLRRLRSSVNSASSGRNKSAPQVYKSHGGKHIKRRPFPATPLEQSEAQLLFPMPVRVYLDPVNCRWQAFLPSLGTRSKSVHLHGHVEGLRQLLVWAWRERLERDGEDLSSCPISGLFPDSSGAAASSSSRA